ncbi:MAG: AEC family transporter [Dorea sp.]
MLLLQQMLVLFTYMILGYWACKKEFLDTAASSKISWIVVNIANPAMILSSAVNGDGVMQGRELLTTFLLAIVMYAILLLLASVLPRIVRVPESQRNLYCIMTVFNNIGFMGFPLIMATYGSKALLYAAVFMLPFNVLLYTYGIQTFEGKSVNGEKLRIKKIFNVGTISCLIATVLYLSQIPVPQVVKSVTQGLSNLTGPLSMMVIGISLAGMQIRSLFTDKKLLIYSFLKLLLIPVIGTLIITKIIDNQMLCEVCMIMLATPAASMTVMMAEQYGGDEEFASKGVALTTLLSVVTIPLVSAIVF